ncbi:MAG: 50S ribosomal protein L11 [Candidatus Dadabacteria bacterium]|nr:50S ribosomal protein L11 [Candidatus Dadabacteria bacterium]NIX15160.1 50S ribosomal protein L11 [Candidatus Dadabacteria bacterium]NIY21805.1 50S ribosomal protein L11 [Candidatus Dadabacteria bacterium]
MKKEVGQIKLLIEGGKASPSPPVGPALGQRGVNIMEFCKAFNAQTQNSQDLLPVTVTVYADRSFSFIVKTPPVSYLLKKAAGIKKGSGEVPRVKAGSVTKDQIKDIANTKMEDLNADTMESAVRIIEGTAKSMGLDVQ